MIRPMTSFALALVYAILMILIIVSWHYAPSLCCMFCKSGC